MEGVAVQILGELWTSVSWVLCGSCWATLWSWHWPAFKIFYSIYYYGIDPYGEIKCFRLPFAWSILFGIVSNQVSLKEMSRSEISLLKLSLSLQSVIHPNNCETLSYTLCSPLQQTHLPPALPHDSTVLFLNNSTLVRLLLEPYLMGQPRTQCADLGCCVLAQEEHWLPQ